MLLRCLVQLSLLLVGFGSNPLLRSASSRHTSAFVFAPKTPSALFSRSRRYKPVNPSVCFSSGEEVEGDGDGEEDDTEISSSPLLSRKSRKHVLVVGFVGSPYSGSQRNANSKKETVEEVLFTALRNCGFVKENDSFGRVRWSSSGRTDKGVHAVRLVFAVKLTGVLGETLEAGQAASRKINEELKRMGHPIEVFDVIRVIRGFSARYSCRRRRYTYLLPVSALSINHLGAVGKKLAGSRTATWHKGGDVWNYFKRQEDAAESLDWTEWEAENGGREGRRRAVEISGLVETIKNLRSGKIEIPWYALKLLDEELARFEGIRAMHSFARGVEPGSGQSYRNVFRCRAVPTLVTINKEPFIEIELESQGFLYHQIRRMVGFAVEIARRRLLADRLRAEISASTSLLPPIGPLFDSFPRLCVAKTERFLPFARMGHRVADIARKAAFFANMPQRSFRAVAGKVTSRALRAFSPSRRKEAEEDRERAAKVIEVLEHFDIWDPLTTQLLARDDPNFRDNLMVFSETKQRKRKEYLKKKKKSKRRKGAKKRQRENEWDEGGAVRGEEEEADPAEEGEKGEEQRSHQTKEGDEQNFQSSLEEQETESASNHTQERAILNNSTELGLPNKAMDEADEKEEKKKREAAEREAEWHSINALLSNCSWRVQSVEAESFLKERLALHELALRQFDRHLSLGACICLAPAEGLFHERASYPDYDIVWSESKLNKGSLKRKLDFVDVEDKVAAFLDSQVYPEIQRQFFDPEEARTTKAGLSNWEHFLLAMDLKSFGQFWWWRAGVPRTLPFDPSSGDLVEFDTRYFPQAPGANFRFPQSSDGTSTGGEAQEEVDAEEERSEEGDRDGSVQFQKQSDEVAV
uniref:Pseudouridine synthase I TruA alpha/beta domain-containing protein n=1 Tax=Chromera velia CCMP2878 TaxID=1169474 RepID=A0A0G4I0W1_9ALVE|eukprot:Cvel_10041.t1-p1 / transcript=Cvel_10041.t1 / gene=Cvel_10041 / organism=Chromera_velia_CCMP2878 / gene_product=tRNA pseudouridine(27/28) synthase, putative / transcript_product=tRNA pseudouridine(27/28) synthase, putative / location=Cvel_scaffold597:33451-38731(-) / protein_length=865 / sequence_SO=supercontig / SO=protein_coding / is_pseudo=false